MTRRTGAGMALNPDNVYVFWIVVIFLSSSILGCAVASVDGLLLAASWYEPPALRWTLPLAVDIFLIATALATLALRKRGAYLAALGVAITTVVLVLFSATTNFLAVYNTANHDTIPGIAGPWIKAAMPCLLLAATEIIAAMLSTRNNKENSPLNRAKAETRKVKADLKKMRAERDALAATPRRLEIEPASTTPTTSTL